MYIFKNTIACEPLIVWGVSKLYLKKLKQSLAQPQKMPIKWSFVSSEKDFRNK